ncbi:MAG TPA: hypothetical protein V6C81_25695 [Planktothrix sp.]|jgi:hypothetical protein
MTSACGIPSEGGCGSDAAVHFQRAVQGDSNGLKTLLLHMINSRSIEWSTTYWKQHEAIRRTSTDFSHIRQPCVDVPNRAPSDHRFHPK